MKVIDFKAERDTRNAPDPDCISTDQHGIPLHLFAIDYQMSEKTFSFQLWAYSWADAETQVSSMRETLTVAGKVKAMGAV